MKMKENLEMFSHNQGVIGSCPVGGTQKTAKINVLAVFFMHTFFLNTLIGNNLKYFNHILR